MDNLPPIGWQRFLGIDGIFKYLWWSLKVFVWKIAKNHLVQKFLWQYLFQDNKYIERRGIVN